MKRSGTPPSFLVKKFGGTSVGSIERIEALAERLKRDWDKSSPPPIVVVSAMSGETNRLISLGEQIDPEYRGEAYDMLVASGEQVSVALLAMALQKRGLKATPLLAHQVGIQTDSTFAKARIKKIEVSGILNRLQDGIIPVVAGFQGVNSNDTITTLGRGGSDTTAVALAAALNQALPEGQQCDCEIYTDVPAVFTADPRLVPKAREIQNLNSDEMMEMAALGSKVLHIRCVEIGAKYGVRIHLRSTFTDRTGTWIIPSTGSLEKDSAMKKTKGSKSAKQTRVSKKKDPTLHLSLEEPVVSAVTHDPNTAIFTLAPAPEGGQFLADLFRELADKGVIVDIIATSPIEGGVQLSFSVSKEDIPLTKQVLKRFLKPSIKVLLAEGKAKLSVVGVGMRNHPGVAARFFQVLAKNKIPIHLVTTSEIKISVVIESQQLAKAAQSLHTEFELDANS